MLKAVIYVRVSTEEQAESGTSLETQELTCLRRAAALGAAVAATYRDEGVSGALYASRPGIQAALRDIESGLASVLIVANLSRFSRDAEHQQQIKKRIERARARLILCDMEIADTPEGDLQFGIMGQFAQYERQVIRNRTMTGRRRRAEEGSQPARAVSPIGYHVVQNAEALAGLYAGAPAGSYVLLEDEACIVREIFRRVVDGQSIRSVALWLIESGVPTRRGGAAWYVSTLRCVLKNPVYKGEPAFGRTSQHTDEERAKEGLKPRYPRATAADSWVMLHCEPIVDADTWTNAQERLRQNKVIHGGPRKARHLLSGLMRCAGCDRGMVSRYIQRKLGGPRYYLCPAARAKMDMLGRVCTPGQHRADAVEAMVLRTVGLLKENPQWFGTALKVYRQMRAEARTQHAGGDRERLAAQLQSLLDRETATARAQVQALIEGRGTQVYDRLLTEIYKERQEVQSRLARLGAPTQEGEALPDFESDAAKVAEVLRRVDVVLSSEEVPTIEKRAILLTLIKGIRPLGTPSEGRYEMELRGVSRSEHQITMVCPS